MVRMTITTFKFGRGFVYKYRYVPFQPHELSRFWERIRLNVQNRTSHNEEIRYGEVYSV
jgi:hypothetical protein